MYSTIPIVSAKSKHMQPHKTQNAHLFNATDVLDGCFVGLMLAYGSRGPLLRRFIMFAGVERPDRCMQADDSSPVAGTHTPQGTAQLGMVRYSTMWSLWSGLRVVDQTICLKSRLDALQIMRCAMQSLGLSFLSLPDRRRRRAPSRNVKFDCIFIRRSLGFFRYGIVHRVRGIRAVDCQHGPSAIVR